MEELNQLEYLLVKTIIEENSRQYTFLNSHLAELKVKKRTYTGVGIYTDFDYLVVKDKMDVNTDLSCSKSLLINDLQYELTFVMSISSGSIDFLEVVTNGDELWDGTINKFQLIEK